MEKANCDNPNAFWGFIKSLRKNKKSGIPNEVYVGDTTETTCDLQEVLARMGVGLWITADTA